MTRPIPTHVPFWRTGPALAVYWIAACTVLGALVGAK
jgi:hypothetical protein